jgi:replicative DNA helicase Mcm
LRSQERPAILDGGRQPEKVVTELAGSLLKSMVPGDRVEVTGVLRLKQEKASREMKSVFEAKSVTHHDQDYSEVRITPEFEAKAKEFVAGGNVIPRIVSSVATSIHGLQFEKTAILLSLFGGVQRRRKDKSIRRGHIHVLMAGDPGTAKSQLLRYYARIAPRSVHATGKGASAAGLSAAVVKDDISDSGGWMVEAGAMVLANNGTMFLDELDKMDAKDASAMHEALEQGTVTINKAGLNLTLNASCNVIAAANPKEGRFDQYQPLHSQLNLTPALVSRFDLIFILLDRPGKDKDSALVDHIFTNELGEASTEVLSEDFIRNYIAYARKFNPTHTKESLEPFKPYFIGMRGTVENTTARQLEALMRLAEAHAKANLRNSVTREDSEAALLIHRAYLESQAVDPRQPDKLNLGNFSGAGTNLSQHDRIVLLLDIIRRLSKDDIRGYCDENKVVGEAMNIGIGYADALKSLAELERSGKTYAKGGPGTWASLT